ncbi:hypothetical protein ACEQ6A_08865 [Rhizobium brockwellii]|uniref:hypothetical protein n=1 Tax=Rhizobium brockwellii TaxID=3019932 RepID=UPI003F98E7A8
MEKTQPETSENIYEKIDRSTLVQSTKNLMEENNIILGDYQLRRKGLKLIHLAIVLLFVSFMLSIISSIVDYNSNKDRDENLPKYSLAENFWFDYDFWHNENYWTVFFNKVPFLFSPSVLILGACVYVKWRERRELSFKIMDTVQGKNFIETRFGVLELMSKADGKSDIQPIMVNWFPNGTSFVLKSDATQLQFDKDHAIPNMAFLLFQIYTYYQLDLIDKYALRHLFYGFFSHYQIIMLEYAAALKVTRKKYEDKYCLDRRWDRIADGIDGFYRLIGFSMLPNSHYYFFFPTLNDLNEKQKKYLHATQNRKLIGRIFAFCRND